MTRFIVPFRTHNKYKLDHVYTRHYTRKHSRIRAKMFEVPHATAGNVATKLLVQASLACATSYKEQNPFLRNVLCSQFKASQRMSPRLAHDRNVMSHSVATLILLFIQFLAHTHKPRYK
jgi:hypothetical protein